MLLLLLLYLLCKRDWMLTVYKALLSCCGTNRMRDMQLVPGCNCLAGESGQSLVLSLQMLSDVWGLFSVPGPWFGTVGSKWEAWRWREQTCTGHRPGKWLWPRQLSVASLWSFCWLSPLLLRNGGACALLSDRHTIFIGGVSKDASTIEAPFWLFNETFNERNYGSKMFREPEDQTSMFQIAILIH